MHISQQYILILGSNLGNKSENIKNAIRMIREAGCKILKESLPMRTKPEMQKIQPEFLNAGILIESQIPPEQLFEVLQQIELQIGRNRRYRYGPREIDIDIVWWSIGQYQSSRLEIPHRWNNARHWVREILSNLLPDNSFLENYYKAMNTSAIKNIQDFATKKKASEKIVMLTAYDYSMARVLARTSVDVLLVGDSLGNVVLGYDTTLKVTLEDMISHGAAVCRGASDKFVVVDMPYLSYHINSDEAVRNAGSIITRTGASAVKLEGGAEFTEVIAKIIRAGIPVMGHLGLMPQSILKTGGYRVQGKTETARQKLIEDALRLQDAGVFALVMEMIPAELGDELVKKLEIPVIGIGAGPEVDGQVLVINDLLGFYDEISPRFLRKYSNLSNEIIGAVENFSRDVRQKNYPNKEESYSAE